MPGHESTDERPMALLISSRNCEPIIGQSWRWCRDFARAHGVRIYEAAAQPGKRAGKHFIDAAELVAAIRRDASSEEPASAPADEDPNELESMRKKLGMRRRACG